LGFSKYKNYFKLLVFFAIIALFGDLIANEKPLYCRIKGETYFPAFRQLASEVGWLENANYPMVNNWLTFSDYENVVKTPIPYSASTQDEKNRKALSPFAAQNTNSIFYRHWLGTDDLGRDVFAGIIHGVKVAFFVGIGATFLAFLIGVFFGSLAGFYADDKIRLSFLSIIVGLFFTFYISFITVQIAGYQSLIFVFLAFIGLFFLIKIIEKSTQGKIKTFMIPIDSFLSRLIEVKRAIPSLIIFFVLATLIKKCSIGHLIVILGVLSWMFFALLTRAEIMRVKNMEYAAAAKSLGFSDLKILFNHILPNALMPSIVLAANTVSHMIIAESGLSFLGVGLPSDYVTWGSLMRKAGSNIEAWWLVLFPGLCIFGVIIFFNRLAEKMRN
jgi:peptide/nickel transport system permease protein